MSSEISPKVSFRLTKVGISAVLTMFIYAVIGPPIWFIATTVLYQVGMGRGAETLGGIISAILSFMAAYLIVTIIMWRYMKNMKTKFQSR